MSSSRNPGAIGLLAVAACLLTGPAGGADWPMWRHDAERSASTEEELSAELSLQWTLRLPAPSPAWPEDPRLGFDASSEPIVAGGRLIVASSRDDSVSAFNVESAALAWRVFAGGPVRFAPVAAGGRIWFGADDGTLSCLDLESGREIWKLAPARSRMALGNGRLISAQPVRGGPVLAGGRLCFSAGIWPFEGAFLYSVDVERSASAPVFSRLALAGDALPQGYLVATGGRVIAPRGRAKAAAIDPATGREDRLAYDSKGFTDWHASASGPYLFHGRKAFDRDRGRTLPVTAPRPVSTGSVIWFGDTGGAIRAVDLASVREVEGKDREGKPTKKLVLDDLWRIDNEAVANAETVKERRAAGTEEAPNAAYDAWLAENPMVVALRAGRRIYGHQARTVFAVDLPVDVDPAQPGGAGTGTDQTAAPSVSWRRELDARPTSMLAAAGRLFVVTDDGGVHCFGGARAEPREVSLQPRSPEPPAIDPEVADRARRLCSRAPLDDGYALVLGAGDGRLVEAMARLSTLDLIVLERDRAAADALRRRFDGAGLLGRRVAVLVGDGLLARLPPYLAVLVVAGADEVMDAEDVAEVFRVLRPYGGVACVALPERILVEAVAREGLAGAKVSSEDGLTALAREGALPGSADWTREYGDEGNTLTSRETLVKAPLGLLWFGGPAGDSRLFYNRHNWPPSLTVIDGRMIIQGPGVLAAIDVYTGRVFWRTELVDGGGSPSRRADVTFVSGDRMGNPGFGLQPAGYNMLVEPDAIYLAYPDRCLLFDPRNGERLGELRIPDAAPGDAGMEWGRIRTWNDLLVVSVLEARDDDTDRQRLPIELIALDRRSGEIRWRRAARNAFPFVAIGKGRLLAFDADLEKLYRDKRRMNAVPKASDDKLLVALDVATGEEKWSKPFDMIAMWLSFSEEHDILIASNSEEIRALHGSNGYELWKKKATGVGFKGHPENLVHKVILWKDRVIDQRGPGLAYNLWSGTPMKTHHPLTGEEVDWEFTKIGHHCNYAVASEHLLTFRAASAGFHDLETGGTAHLEGFRSGCRNSLIPANGVLNAPNFAHGCICSYSIFTSLALVHRPEGEEWTYSAFKSPEGRIRRLGINLGAPGDRRDPGGTLWLDYPSAGGPSPEVAVEIVPEKPRWFSKHSGEIGGEGLAWVCASGAKGVTSMTIALDGRDDGDDEHVGDESADGGEPATRYTVRLAFLEPDARAEGETVFSIRLQGEEVLRDLDLVRAAGGADRGVVREFKGVAVAGKLTIDLVPAAGETSLCGVEVIAE